MLLSFLVALSVILTISIWFGEKLWSLDYSFFSDFSLLPSKNTTQNRNATNAQSVLGMPKSILVSSNGLKNVLDPSSEGFLSLWKSTKSSLGIFLSSSDKQKIRVDEKRWKSVLQGDGIYVDYKANYSTEFLAQNYHCDDRIDSYVFNAILIKPPDPESDQYSFLFQDVTTGNIYEFYVSDPQLHLLPANYLPADAANQNQSFSFEINFDKSNQESSPSAQQVVIDSMVLLNLNADQKPVITPINPLLTSQGDLNETLVNKVAMLFNVNPQTTRKFTDEDQSITFVENYAVLKIHADGYIEYHTTDESAAPALDNPKGGSYGTVYAASQFIDTIITATDCQNQLMLTSDLTKAPTNGDITMSYDYKINAIPVILNVTSSSHDSIEKAVEIQIRNNKIVSYKHYLRHYAITSANAELSSSITALDKLLADQHSAAQMTISDMSPVYWDDANTALLNPRWYIRLNNNKSIVLN